VENTPPSDDATLSDAAFDHGEITTPAQNVHDGAGLGSATSAHDRVSAEVQTPSRSVDAAPRGGSETTTDARDGQDDAEARATLAALNEMPPSTDGEMSAAQPPSRAVPEMSEWPIQPPSESRAEATSERTAEVRPASASVEPLPAVALPLVEPFDPAVHLARLEPARFEAVPTNAIIVSSGRVRAVKTPSGSYALAELIVTDSDDRPVAGALVTVAWSGLVRRTNTGTTDANGRVALVSRATARAGKIRMTVRDVTKNGYAYEPLESMSDATAVVRK